MRKYVDEGENECRCGQKYPSLGEGGGEREFECRHIDQAMFEDQ